MAIGDDVTDEDMFRQLSGDERAFTIKVGSDKSAARYNVYTPAMVHALLEMLSKANG
jgi:trehalose-phosphatase